jgi:hypothetical protein
LQFYTELDLIKMSYLQQKDKRLKLYRCILILE